LELLERYGGNYLSVNRFKLGQVLTVGSVFEGVEIGLEVDAALAGGYAIASRVSFKVTEIRLVELV